MKKRNLSKVVKHQGKMFRYDFDNCLVQHVSKATNEEIKDNEEWQMKHGRDLWDIDEDGYIEIDSVGLGPENWRNKEARDEYLDEYCFDLNEETSYESYMFEKYELPFIQQEA